MSKIFRLISEVVEEKYGEIPESKVSKTFDL